MAAEEPMELFIGPLPMLLNLGDFGNVDSVIGWARGYCKADGTTHIAIELDKDASKKLIRLDEVFDLMAIGFAGYAKDPRRHGR